MSKTSVQKIEVRQGIDPEYFSNILTKDVTTLECILELVDNAVDAARDKILRRKSVKLDRYGLPADYSGYTINVDFEDGSIKFTDDCTGIPESTLRNSVFVVGAMSSHSFGIGRFGIGLKRALFGLGTRYIVESDTGRFSARLDLDISEMRDFKAPLIATRRPSNGKSRMFIHVTQLHERVKSEIKQAGWDGSISKQLSRRYGLLIDKGFQIRVNGNSISRFGPGLRDIAGVKRKSSDVRLVDGVDVYIDSGMHEDYRLTSEADHRTKANASLTDQFGWYFVCNDRIVEVATRENSLGWTARWHQEYYGFVGWVRFVARNPQNLPWDTKKSRIDPYSTVFMAISERLQSFAEHYKKQNKKERISPSGGDRNSPPSNEPNDRPVRGATDKPVKSTPKPLPPHSHNENWKTLLPPLGFEVKNRKLAALVFEAEQLSLTHCYAGSMLLRTLMEMALLAHLRSRRKLGQVIEEVRKKANDSTEKSETAATSMDRLTLNEMLRWLANNEIYFPEEVRRDCVFSRKKFATNLKELNGIVHDGDLTNSDKLRSARDDAMPLLEFLLASFAG
ncbi:ATP-binding protein [Castellaniella sp. MT123]|uniref:ATP-binding protein n=1 Tax=Castellaniella sp. MT123 TaxID=3140381 RepID=UPI0031F44F26